jgi:hypothetical protein
VIRGACQQFKFKTPYDLEQLKTVHITFWQPDNNGTEDCILPITKQLTDCKQDQLGINVTLNQVETLAFSEKSKAFVQFRGLTTEGFAFASRIMPINVYPVKDETVLE